jgi:hypothetical protein
MTASHLNKALTITSDDTDRYLRELGLEPIANSRFDWMNEPTPLTSQPRLDLVIAKSLFVVMAGILLSPAAFFLGAGLTWMSLSAALLSAVALFTGLCYWEGEESRKTWGVKPRPASLGLKFIKTLLLLDCGLFLALASIEIFFSPLWIPLAALAASCAFFILGARRWPGERIPALPDSLQSR